MNFRSDFMHAKGRPGRQMFSGKGSIGRGKGRKLLIGLSLYC